MLRIFSIDLSTLLLASILLHAVTAEGVSGQLTESEKERLVEQIGLDATALDPNRLPDLDDRKRHAVLQIESVEQYLSAATSPENQTAWLKYLNMDPLAASIQEDRTLAEIGQRAVDLRYRLIGTAPGLELAAIVSLRDSVTQLIDAIRFRDRERTVTLIERQLENLAKRIDDLSEIPSSSEIAEITTIVGLLASSRQASDTVTALRETFGQPNVAVLIDESLIRLAVDQDIDRTQPVRDCILGTRILGTARLTGVVSAKLLPSVGSARVRVSLLGSVVSQNTGYNGPVRLRTAGFGDVNVSRTVRIGDSGIDMEPISSQAELRTEVQRIEHHLKLVRKIARKRVAQQKSLADRIATGRLRDRVGELFAEQTEQASQSTPEALTEAEPMLKRLSLSPPTRIWNSTDDRVSVDAVFRGHDQLAAVVPPPPIVTAYQAAIQLHESIVDNAFNPVLAGRTMTEAKLDELLDSVGRSPATQPDADDGESDPPFEIDFARVQPIVFAARDQSIRIGVRGTRFAQGRRELKRAMEITATYHPSRSGDGKITLIREEEIDVDFPGDRPLTISQAGLRPTIKKKFDNLFPRTLLDRNLELPSTSSIETLRGRAFDPVHVDATDGWLSVAFRT